MKLERERDEYEVFSINIQISKVELLNTSKANFPFPSIHSKTPRQVTTKDCITEPTFYFYSFSFFLEKETNFDERFLALLTKVINSGEKVVNNYFGFLFFPHLFPLPSSFMEYKFILPTLW